MRNERNLRKKEGNTVAKFVTVNNAWDFIDRIKEQGKKWKFFEIETFVTEVRKKFFFEVEIKTKQEEVCGSSMGIRISGFEGTSVTSVVADSGSGSEEFASFTLRDFSEVIEKASRRVEQLEEFIQICDFIKSLFPEQVYSDNN